MVWLFVYNLFLLPFNIKSRLLLQQKLVNFTPENTAKLVNISLKKCLKLVNVTAENPLKLVNLGFKKCLKLVNNR